MHRFIHRHIDANYFMLASFSTEKIVFWKKAGFVGYAFWSFFIDIGRIYRPNNNSIKHKPNLCSRPVWIYESQNNYRSLFSISRYFDNSVFITHSRGKNKGCKSDCLITPSGTVSISFSDALRKLYFLLYIVSSQKFSPIYFKTICDFFWRNESAYKMIRSVLKNDNPAFIVTSNDINPYTRIILRAFKEKGIPRYYVQHASVSSNFPPLNFTKSFLFGAQSLDMYTRNRDNSDHARIELVGNHLLDEFQKIASSKPCLNGNRLNIGIAFNTLDDLSKVYETYQVLSQLDLESEIYLKPHPRESRDLTLLSKTSVLTDLNEFLNKIDVLLTGVSGIILDAVLCNINVFQLDWLAPSQKLNKDYYGFLKMGICSFFSNEDLAKHLNAISKSIELLKPVRHRAQYFDASIGTPWEWNVSKKIADEIRNDINSTLK